MISASVVVPVLNGADTIGALLSALQRQSGVCGAVEILVVDNGSTDETRDIVRSFPQIQLLEEPVRGPAAARNRGLRTASGEVIVYCDADTLPSRTWLVQLLAAFDDPSVVIAVGQTLCFRPTTAVERYIAAAGIYSSEKAISRPPFSFAPSLNMAVRRGPSLAAGGWCEELMTAEDVDFSHRVLTLFPSEIAYRPGAVLFHRTRSTLPQLRRLAYSYGRGMAEMYLRYPEEVSWDTATTARTAWKLLQRVVHGAALTAAARIGLAKREDAEFRRYHALWLWSYLKGFANVYYVRRSPRGPLGFVLRLRNVLHEPGDAEP